MPGQQCWWESFTGTLPSQADLPLVGKGSVSGLLQDRFVVTLSFLLVAPCLLSYSMMPSLDAEQVPASHARVPSF